ncbi:cyclic GMP-AMP synthase-like receptor isoform X2 [Diabrotica virgifera virgifera]|uniref:Cyclic GMP-AMP synthase-like n=1 Tax=Diabrotica virgifera virgifera TaxID=50390 RepID=A0ABM5JQ09_DIAVI|nr:cyclic GMP-AMP synthase-like receptor isoform X2 [Diabrotica virgifera virgifera]
MTRSINSTLGVMVIIIANLNMAATEDTRNYVAMENILQKINSKYISLPEDDKRRNNKILDAVTKIIEKKMQETDPLFKKMFRKEKYFGGSYYDGLKVGKPEEYDLDLLLELPPEVKPAIEVSEKHGFVHVVLNDISKLTNTGTSGKKNPILYNTRRRKHRYRWRLRWTWNDTLNTLLVDSKYLSTFKLLSWFEKVISTSLKDFKTEGTEECIFDVDVGEEDILKVYGKFHKASPASTLKLKCSGNINLDIDLVPCFVFTGDMWPKENYRPNPVSQKSRFLVVPKIPHGEPCGPQNPNNIYWRLSFQEQERELISGNQYNTMKATIKLLKKLRDEKNHKIASYFLKTIFLWEVEEREPNFWSKPLSVVFMEMLIKYESRLRKKDIPYYWNNKYNLIGHIKDITIENIANYIKQVIDSVNRKVAEDPFTIAYYILPPTDVEDLKSQVNIGKKYKKLMGDSNTVDSTDDQLESIHSRLDQLTEKVDLLYKLMQNTNVLLTEVLTVGKDDLDLSCRE